MRDRLKHSAFDDNRFHADGKALLHRRVSSRLRWLICGLLLPFLFISLQAQSFDLKKYSTGDGLSQPFVYNALQDQAGFIWLGTSAGLCRFDGMKFKVFTKRDGLADDFITCSYRDNEERLWFGHNDGSLTQYAKGKFTIAIKGSANPSAIIGIREDDYQNIWILTQREGFIKIDRQGKATYFKDGFKDQLMYAFDYCGKGKFLVGTSEGLFMYKVSGAGSTPKLSHSFSQIPTTRINCISASPKNGKFWVSTEDAGIFSVKPGRIPSEDSVLSFGKREGFPTEEVQTVLEGIEGELWLGFNQKGLKRWVQTDGWHEQILAGPADSLDKINVRAVMQDAFGQIWVATNGQGVMCLSKKGFSFLESSVENAKHVISCVMEDSEHNFWMGTANGLVKTTSPMQLRGGNIFTIVSSIPLASQKLFSIREGLPAADVHCLHEFPAGTLWIGTTGGGLAKLDMKSGKINTIDLGTEVLAATINDIINDNKGMLWIGTRGGVFRLDPQTRQYELFTTQNGLPHNNVTDLHLSNKNEVWLASLSNRAAWFDGKAFKTLGMETENVMPEINCITQDQNGKFWFGTDGAGLIGYDGKNFSNVSTEEGLMSNFCYQIFADKNNHIWITHRNGISRMVPGNGKVVQYRDKDILVPTGTNLNQVTSDLSSNLWFATDKGLLQYNLDSDHGISMPPALFITSFQIFDEEREMTDGLQLRFEKYRFHFEFLGLTLIDQDKVKYRYKLVGNDIDWSDVTSSTVATYQGLNYGEYTFMVQACNKFGVWNESPISFTFTILPPFWATWWFRTLVVVVSILILFGYVRYRVYRFRKEKQFLEDRIRERTIELIDEKEKLEKAYLEIQKLSLAVSETSNAIFILDKEGNLEWVNNGFTRMTGYSLGEMLELRKGKRFIDTSSNSHIGKLLSQAISTNQPVSYESTLPTKEGEPIWVVSTLTPILNKEGVMDSIVIIDSDISDRKQAEQEIQKMNETLELLVAERTQELNIANTQLQHENKEHIKTTEKLRLINQELDTFIYRASHDLKGPLASLIGLVGLSRSEVKDVGALRYIELMERSAIRLDSILVDLLEATAIKQAKPVFEKIDLHALSQKIIDSLARQEHAAGIQLQNDVPEGFYLVSDEKILSSAVQNLLDNGIKYQDNSKPNPFVKISARQSGIGPMITISDNGKGIAAEMADKVFEMFFRSDTSARGSGLGLYIVKNAVDKISGKIELQSEVGVGSSFHIQLPESPESGKEN